MDTPLVPMRRPGKRALDSVGPPPEAPPGQAELVDSIQTFPRRRTYLLPALHEVQRALGWLPDWAIELVGAHLRVPKSEAYGIASSFPDFLLREPALHTVRICTGASCRAAGGIALLERLHSEATMCSEADCLFICGVGPAAEVDGCLLGRASAERVRATQLPTANAGAMTGPSRHSVPSLQSTPTVLVQDGTCSRAAADTAHAPGRKVGCAGNCWQAPASSTDGGRTWRSADRADWTWPDEASPNRSAGGHSARDTPDTAVAHSAGDSPNAFTAQGGLWQRPGEVRLLRKVGVLDPLEPPAFNALERALSLGSDRVLQLVKDSGLRGRGGAYFAVGTKWETARNTPADKKYLLVNAEEGEPGIFKDRHLLEGDPHSIVEGIQIAALGIGATDVVIFVNGEARLGLERLQAALQQARDLRAVRVSVEVRLGAGGYVLGEETALINAIHGQRAEPLARPPFPAVSGLFSSPTVINNAETLANLPDLVLNGADWFRAVGTSQTPGTKLVSLAGAVNRPGLYEAPLGIPLRRIIQEYGGGTSGELAAVLVGGPSGSILPASVLDTPFDVQPLQAVGGVLGAGGIVPLRADQCVVHAVRELVAYNQRESCGKCTPCREGTVRMLHLFTDLCQARADEATLGNIDELNDVLAFASLCGLGQMAPNPVRALLRHFRSEVDVHVNGRCSAGVCTNHGVA